MMPNMYPIDRAGFDLDPAAAQDVHQFMQEQFEVGHMKTPVLSK